MADVDPRPQLREILKTLGDLRTDVQKLAGETKKVRDVIRSGFESLQDAVYENIRAQAELKLMEHVMDVRSVKPQIEAEYDQIQTERSELSQQLEGIGDRYDRKHDKLDQQAAERVRELGSHIFEIDETEFEEGIERPFTEQVTTTWQTLQTHNEEVRTEREDAIRGTAGDTVQTIHDFLDRQQTLLDRVDEHKHGSDTIPAEDDVSRLQIPYYTVTYEVDGVTQRTVVAPSELTRSADEDAWFPAELQAFDGAESLVGDPAPLDGARSRTLPAERLVDPLERYEGSSRLGLSYTASLTDALGDTVALRTEGDD